ncbi:MAG: hypothetical protein JWM19_948 [Actinomycetia bacterium]|nr:hypothetical protein [Actinomycetes bacterium]
MSVSLSTPDDLLEQVTVQKQYYTLCMACGHAFGDFSDDLRTANRNRRHHLAWHRKQAAIKAEAAGREES